MATRIRVSSRALLEKIRETASSSSNVVFIPEPEKRSMAGMMTFHQALQCVRAGKIVGEPVRNEYGDWELRMERYAANFNFTARIIAECDGAHVKRIIVFLEQLEES